MVDETRTTHIWRQRAEDDDDVWVDIQRVDKWVSTKGQEAGFQKTTYNFKWDDEAAPFDHPTRTVKMVEAKDPENDGNVVEVPVTKNYQSYRSDQKITHSFVNGEAIETRKYSVRKVYHHDVEVEPDQRLDGADYLRIDGTKDESQYIYVALVESITTTKGQEADYQKEIYRYNTEPIEQYSEPAQAGEYTEDQVLHLDPLQNVVNVQWVESQNFLIGYKKTLLGSKDGTQWTTLWSGGSGGVGDITKIVGLAYIKGNWFMTVLKPGSGLVIFRTDDGFQTWHEVFTGHSQAILSTGDFGNCLAAGIPRNGIGEEPAKPTIVCAVRIDSTNGAGVVASQDLGETWTPKEFPGEQFVDGARAEFASFCNGLFFVGGMDYLDSSLGGALQARYFLQVSQDGVNWTHAPVLTEHSSLVSTDFFGDNMYMLQGGIGGVTWNGDKENPTYYTQAVGFWVHAEGGAMAIASSTNGLSWQQSGGPFGDWNKWSGLEQFDGPYQANENNFTSPAAGQITINGTKQTRICLPFLKYTGVAPADISTVFHVSSADAGMFTSPGGTEQIVISGIVPTSTGTSTEVAVYPGFTAYSKKNNGTFVTTFFQKSSWDAARIKIYVSSGSSTAWQVAHSFEDHITVSENPIIAVGRIPLLENPVE